MNISNNINQARKAFAAAGISFIGTGSYQKLVPLLREDGWKTCDEAYARLKAVDFAINARAEQK